MESKAAQGERQFYSSKKKYTNGVRKKHIGHMPCPKQGSEMRPGLASAWEQLTGIPVALGRGPDRARGGILFC